MNRLLSVTEVLVWFTLGITIITALGIIAAVLQRKSSRPAKDAGKSKLEG